MSKIGKVQLMMFENFADGKAYTTDEFKEKAIELKLIDENDKYTIRNTLHKIRKFPEVKALGNGRYIIEQRENEEEKKKINEEEREDESDMTVEKAFLFLNERLKNIKKMNVINSSYDELQKGKAEIEIYNKYTSEFNHTLNKN